MPPSSWANRVYTEASSSSHRLPARVPSEPLVTSELVEQARQRSLAVVRLREQGITVVPKTSQEREREARVEELRRAEAELDRLAKLTGLSTRGIANKSVPVNGDGDRGRERRPSAGIESQRSREDERNWARPVSARSRRDSIDSYSHSSTSPVKHDYRAPSPQASRRRERERDYSTDRDDRYRAESPIAGPSNRRLGSGSWAERDGKSTTSARYRSPSRDRYRDSSRRGRDPSPYDHNDDYEHRSERDRRKDYRASSYSRDRSYSPPSPPLGPHQLPPHHRQRGTSPSTHSTGTSWSRSPTKDSKPLGWAARRTASGKTENGIDRRDSGHAHQDDRDRESDHSDGPVALGERRKSFSRPALPPHLALRLDSAEESKSGSALTLPLNTNEQSTSTTANSRVQSSTARTGWQDMHGKGYLPKSRPAPISIALAGSSLKGESSPRSALSLNKVKRVGSLILNNDKEEGEYTPVSATFGTAPSITNGHVDSSIRPRPSSSNGISQDTTRIFEPIAPPPVVDSPPGPPPSPPAEELLEPSSPPPPPPPSPPPPSFPSSLPRSSILRNHPSPRDSQPNRFGLAPRPASYQGAVMHNPVPSTVSSEPSSLHIRGRTRSPTIALASLSGTPEQVDMVQENLSLDALPETWTAPPRPAAAYDIPDRGNFLVVWDPKIDGTDQKKVSVLKKKGKTIPTTRVVRYDGMKNGKEVSVVDPRLELSEDFRSRGTGNKKNMVDGLKQIKPYAWDPATSVGKAPLPPPTGVCITGLSALTTLDQVTRHMRQFGRIAEYDMKTDNRTGQLLGICWIRFEGPLPGKTMTANEVATDVVRRCTGIRIGMSFDEKIKVVLDRDGKKATKTMEEELTSRKKGPKSSAVVQPVPLPITATNLMNGASPAWNMNGSATPSARLPPQGLASSARDPFSFTPHTGPAAAVGPLNGVVRPLQPSNVQHPIPNQNGHVVPGFSHGGFRPPTHIPMAALPVRPSSYSVNLPLHAARPHHPLHSQWLAQQAASQQNAAPVTSHYLPKLPAKPMNRDLQYQGTLDAFSANPFDEVKEERPIEAAPTSWTARKRLAAGASLPVKPSVHMVSAPSPFSNTFSADERDRDGHSDTESSSSSTSNDDWRDISTKRKQPNRGRRHGAGVPPSPIKKASEDAVSLALAENGNSYIFVAAKTLPETTSPEDFNHKVIKPSKVVHGATGWYLLFDDAGAARRAEMLYKGVQVNGRPLIPQLKANKHATAEVAPTPKKRHDLPPHLVMAKVSESPVKQAQPAIEKIQDDLIVDSPVKLKKIKKPKIDQEPVAEVKPKDKEVNGKKQNKKRRNAVFTDSEDDIPEPLSEPTETVVEDVTVTPAPIPEPEVVKKKTGWPKGKPRGPRKPKEVKIDLDLPVESVPVDGNVDTEQVDASTKVVVTETKSKKDKPPPKKKAKKNQVQVVESMDTEEVYDLAAVKEIEAPMEETDIIPEERDPSPVKSKAKAKVKKPLGPTKPKVTTKDLVSSGIAEDEEDLHLIKLALELKRAGLDLPEPGTLDDDDPTSNGDAIGEETISHPSGCSRTHGYYKVSEMAKSAYLPQRNRVATDVEAAAAAGGNTAAIANSRSTRVATRRLVQGMEQHKKSLGTATASDTDVFQFNQLRTRKKQLKFSKSIIHDWGLYAMESIPQGEMVIEYVGEVVRAQVADIREKWYEKIGIGSSYLFRVDDDSVVDATKKGNLGRLINHCCAPNCTAKIITINGDKKIVIYAKSDIVAGDEITYDYHFPIEQEKIVCLCGSDKCRGFLN